MTANTQLLAKIRDIEKLATADAAGGLRKAIHDLLLAVETPRETISRLNFQPLQNICIRIAVEKGWLAVIAQKGSVTAEELATITATSRSFLVRPMRILTNIGLCDEINYQTYAPNKRTHFKIRKGSIGAELHHFDLDFAMGAQLVAYMRGPGICEFADDPNRMTIFQYALGKKSIFQLLEVNPEQKKSFDAYMKEWRSPDMKQWFDLFPVETKFAGARKDADAILFVDIAGGPGQEGELFRQRNPSIPGQCILQELPLTLDRLVHKPQGVITMEHNFFEPQPVKGAHAYFFRHVLHNWSDPNCQRILSHVAEAMDPEYSTLLINDIVLADINVPLVQSEMDMLMWLHVSGKERTKEEWTSLCEAVGLEIIKIWSADNVSESVIEAKKSKPR